MIGHNGGPPMIRGNDGWIAISRAIRTHWLVGFGQPVAPMDGTRGAHSRSEAFIDLLMECRYEAGTVSNGGRKMQLEPGQIVGAVSWLASRWNWTPKTVRLWLDKLQEDGMIERSAEAKGGKQAAIITVCNYSEYQLVRDQQGQANGTQGASKGQARGNIYKDKQGNKGTREQEEDPPTPLQGELAGAVADQELADAKAKRKSINREAAYQAFVEWKAFAKRIGLTVPREASFQTFGQKMAARMYQHAEKPKGLDEMLAVWRLAMSMVERSKLCRGMTPRKFYADLKFLCQPESFDRLITGGYGNGAAHSAPPSQVDPEHDERQRQEREAIEQRLAAEGWHIPNQGVTRE